MSALRIGAAKAGRDFSQNNKKLLWLLEALVKCNMIWLESHPKAPKLYSSGVRYEHEEGTEEWLDIPNILKEGWGDCEDLAAWRIAELRSAGIKAKGYLRWLNRPSEKITLYHVQVLLPDGTIDDPSKRLGMRGES
jgi:hypothetical protein